MSIDSGTWLARLSLRRCIRVFVDTAMNTQSGLKQAGMLIFRGRFDVEAADESFEGSTSTFDGSGLSEVTALESKSCEPCISFETARDWLTVIVFICFLAEERLFYLIEGIESLRNLLSGDITVVY